MRHRFVRNRAIGPASSGRHDGGDGVFRPGLRHDGVLVSAQRWASDGFCSDDRGGVFELYACLRLNCFMVRTNFDLLQFEASVALAERGSFRTAAGRIHGPACC